MPSGVVQRSSLESEERWRVGGGAEVQKPDCVSRIRSEVDNSVHLVHFGQSEEDVAVECLQGADNIAGGVELDRQSAAQVDAVEFVGRQFLKTVQYSAVRCGAVQCSAV